MSDHTFESIQLIKASLSSAEFIGFLKGQAIHLTTVGGSLNEFEQAKLFQNQLVKEHLPSDYGIRPNVK